MLYIHVHVYYLKKSYNFSETPNNDFGKDSVPYGRYVKVFEGKGLTTVDINKIVSKDICNHDTRVRKAKINLVWLFHYLI